MMVVILNIDGHCNNGWHGDCHGSVRSHALQGWNLISKCCLVSLHLFFPFLLVLAAVSMLRLRSPIMLAASVMTKLGKLNYPDDRNFVRKTCDSVHTRSSPFIHLCPLVSTTQPLLWTSLKHFSNTVYWPLGISDDYVKHSIALCFHSPCLNNHLKPLLWAALEHFSNLTPVDCAIFQLQQHTWNMSCFSPLSIKSERKKHYKWQNLTRVLRVG